MLDRLPFEFVVPVETSAEQARPLAPKRLDVWSRHVVERIEPESAARGYALDAGDPGGIGAPSMISASSAATSTDLSPDKFVGPVVIPQ